MSHNIIEINEETRWHQERSKGIGGSDVASVLGLNPYKTNVELWEEKTGRKKPADISAKPCVLYGKKAEDYLRELFILDYPEYEVTHNPYYIHAHKDYDFIRGSFDAELFHKINKEKGIWECKTTEIKRQSDWNKWKDKIPQNYFCQILHYLAIDEEYKFVKLKAQIKSKDKLEETILTTKHYHIVREKYKADIEYLINKEIEFMHYVRADKQPPLLLPEI